MKKIALAALAASMFAGAAHADPEGVNGKLVGLEGSAVFVNETTGDVDNLDIKPIEVKNGSALTEADYDGAM